MQKLCLFVHATAIPSLNVCGQHKQHNQDTTVTTAYSGFPKYLYVGDLLAVGYYTCKCLKTTIIPFYLVFSFPIWPESPIVQQLSIN